MEHKCLYFIPKDGILLCSQCGEPAKKGKIEDKMMPAPANKGQKLSKKVK